MLVNKAKKGNKLKAAKGLTITSEVGCVPNRFAILGAKNPKPCNGERVSSVASGAKSP